ncbi:hypothetical protein A6A04_13920 [Paramagnetospirillum marisnigri]|uniref:Uncharacterized protein n=1 Tax=Paramagnetospirillum marisnigri TaxID=1285242 RepID=A0A178MUF5_9PROT|nr:hypothetical protein [Paramagnetospirillum marisnigri]OAN53697.1 hypothetical protein A6A04_13920 [Paramagnetospirillum marisnigri]
MTHPALVLLLACALALPAAAQAQTVGPKPPPYQPPPKAQPRPETPARDEAPAPRMDTTVNAASFAPRDDVVGRFADAYVRGGRPRLAFYWNRLLSDTLAQWYSDSRTVTAERSSGSTEGDLSLNRSGNRQIATETQRRTGGEQGRPPRPETWEWEFQDGFLGAFLKADAQVVDRTAILRIMGAGAEDMDPRTVEVMALQNMADLMIEVLVAESVRSNTGYELRARVLDMKTGRLLAMVNSRALREWQPSLKAEATSRGFELPDEDDERFGPERSDQRYKATATGFERKRKPPKLSLIAHNLATNVMDALMPRLEAAADAAAQPPMAKAEPAAAPPSNAPMPLVRQPDVSKTVPAPPKPKAPVNDSAVPLPDVDTKPLPPPAKAATVEPSSPPAGDEPPMPKATRQ